MIRATLRRSRKMRRCTNPGCGTMIQPGDQYLEHVCSPDHDGLGNVGWWKLVQCRPCAVRLGRCPIPNGGVEQR